MKNNRSIKRFIDNLKQVPNVSMACRNSNISRNTIYRWQRDKEGFNEKFDEAIYQGVESVNDMAESKLFTLIQAGSMRAIKYWLDNNKKSYLKPRPDSVYDRLDNRKRVTGFDVTIRHAKYEPTSSRDVPKPEKNIKKKKTDPTSDIEDLGFSKGV